MSRPLLLACAVLCAATIGVRAQGDVRSGGISPLAATPAAEKSGGSLPSAEAAIERALDKPTQLEFVETPLQDVVDYLKDFHKIEIQVDKKAMENAGVAVDTAITLNIKGLPLHSALNLLLKQHDLTWTIRDSVLMITTPESEQGMCITKLYDVADLVVCRDRKNQPWDDYDTLTDLITATVEPTEWDTVGGVGSIAGASLGTAKILVVSQAYRTHRKIAELLENIRTIAAKKSGGAELPRRDREAKRRYLLGDLDRALATGPPQRTGSGSTSSAAGENPFAAPAAKPAPRPSPKPSAENDPFGAAPPKPEPAPAPATGGGMF